MIGEGPSGRWFFIVLLAAAPACRAGVTSIGAWNNGGGAGTSLAAGGAGASSASGGAGAAPASGLYFEAESGALSGGYTVESDASASGGEAILPPTGATSPSGPGGARALYSFTVTTPGTYILWGRIHSPNAIQNRFWFQIDGGTWTLWRISTGEVWFWDRAHDDTNYGVPLTFQLAAGSHQLQLANEVDGVGVDRFYLTAGSDAPVGNSTLCDPPNSIQLNGVCSLSCGSQGGNACGTTECAGKPAIPAYDCDVCCVLP